MMKTIDKHQFKITIAMAIIVIIFLITLSSKVAIWKTEIDNATERLITRQDHLAERHTELRERVDIVEEQNNEFKVELAKINTKLTNIETLLVEIKHNLN